MQFENKNDRFALFAEEQFRQEGGKRRGHSLFQQKRGGSYKNKNVDSPGHDWRESSIIAQWKELDAQQVSK